MGYGDDESIRESEDRFDWLLKNDPEFRARLDRDMDRIEAEIAAGRFIPNEVVARHTQRFLETGIWDNDYGEEYKWVFTE
jgi:hypothetical protein